MMSTVNDKEREIEFRKPVAICERCGREFLTLPTEKPYRDGWGYKGTGQACGGNLVLTEKGRAALKVVS